MKTGLNAGEATKQVHQQFGDVEVVLAAMRQKRLASPAVMFTSTAVLAVVAMIWIAQQQLTRTDLRMPAAPAAPRLLPPATLQEAAQDPRHPRALPPPPGPGPGPTWEQYVKQTKAFEVLQKGPGTYSPGAAP